jgi:hypothetical protein
MKTDIVLVEERVIYRVEKTRVISVEVPFGERASYVIRRKLAEGELDFGPFTDLFSPVPGTEKYETLSVRVVGSTDEPADIPLLLEMGVGGR